MITKIYLRKHLKIYWNMLNSVNKITGNTVRWKHLSKSHTTSSRPKSTPIRGQTSQSNEPIPMCVCVCVCLKAGNPSRPSQKCHQSKSCTALQHWHAVMTSGMPGMLELDVIALLLYLVCNKCRAGGKVRTKWFAFFRSSETRSVASVFFCVPTVHLRDGKKELSPRQKSHHLAWHGFWNTKPQSH